MNPAATIQTDAALKHLSEMANLYGYELIPIVPPIPVVIDINTSPKALSKKKNWTKEDTKTAIAFCETEGIGVSTLIPFLKSTLR